MTILWGCSDGKLSIKVSSVKSSWPPPWSLVSPSPSQDGGKGCGEVRGGGGWIEGDLKCVWKGSVSIKIMAILEQLLTSEKGITHAGNIFLAVALGDFQFFY